jgi:DNA (cytosine-5)-methyltransferase 1
MLGGKSVNGLPVMFPYEDSVPYHIYFKVLNSKKYGVPQNRERVFIIGIRDDQDNSFTWPKEEPLTKKLKDVLESEVDEKYFLSDKMLRGLLGKNEQDNGFTFRPKTKEDVGSCVTARCFKMGADDNYIKIKSATSSGYEKDQQGDSINFTHPNNETRRGRVGKEVAQTLDTACNQGVIQMNDSKESGGKQPYQQNRIYNTKGVSPALCRDKSDLLINENRIRRLTPRECFRLQDFPDSFIMPCSDSQMYKQAGNSITTGVLAKIIAKLDL